MNDTTISKIVKDSIKKVLFESKSQKEILDIESVFHFSSIPVEELEKQYVDLSHVVSESGYGGKFLGYRRRIIAEDATKTLSIDETRRQIQKKFKLKDWQFATEDGDNGLSFIILYPGIFRNTKVIQKAMNACGWSMAKKGTIVKDKMLWKSMSFDPLFQDDVSAEAKKFKYAFHWSPMRNYDSIMRDGLVPKSQNKLFKYPDRIHLIKGNTTKNELFYIGAQLYEMNKGLKNNGKYVLFTIDMSKCPKDMEVYYDPRYEYGYYVDKQIPISAITPWFAYDFKNDKPVQTK